MRAQGSRTGAERRKKKGVRGVMTDERRREGVLEGNEGESAILTGHHLPMVEQFF